MSTLSPDENNANGMHDVGGTLCRTGCLVSTPKAMSEAYANNKEYPEDQIWDSKQIQKALPDGEYLRHRQARKEYVINQERLGKCCPSAGKGAIHQRRADQGLPFVEMSDCWAYTKINGGGDNGAALADLAELMKTGYSPKNLESNGKKLVYPEDVYRQNQVSSEMFQAANRESADYKAGEIYAVPKEWDKFVPVVATACARKFPIIIAWHVGGTTLRNGYIQQGRGMGNHANFIHCGKFVGGKDIVHPDDQNSWGAAFGEDGFGLFTMESLFQCTPYHFFFILASFDVAEGKEW